MVVCACLTLTASLSASEPVAKASSCLPHGHSWICLPTQSCLLVWARVIKSVNTGARQAP